MDNDRVKASNQGKLSHHIGFHESVENGKGLQYEVIVRVTFRVSGSWITTMKMALLLSVITDLYCIDVFRNCVALPRAAVASHDRLTAHETIITSSIEYFDEGVIALSTQIFHIGLPRSRFTFFQR